MSTNHGTIIDAFQADLLLANSHILTEITNLKDGLCYDTSSERISFEEYHIRLRKIADRLPRISLLNAVPPGTQSNYSIQLVTAMEKIQDDCESILDKVIQFKAKLETAQGRIKTLSASFCAWYVLAASEVIAKYKVKFSPAQVKTLAEAEYSRLLDGADNAIIMMMSDMKAVEEKIELHKKCQKEKFELGKDQINQTLMNTLPANGNTLPGDRADQLLEIPELEEDDEPAPYVSKKTALEGNPLYSVPADTSEIKGTFKKFGTPVPVTVIGGTLPPGTIFGDMTDEKETFYPEKNESELKVAKDGYGNVYSVEFNSELVKCGDCHELCEKQMYETGVLYVCMNEQCPVFNFVIQSTSKRGAEAEKSWAVRMAEAEDGCGGVMACSPEILKASGGDPGDTLAIRDTFFKGAIEIAGQRERPRPDSIITSIEDIAHTAFRESVLPELGRPLPADELDAIVNAPSPLATPVPTTPRKKLTFLTEDEDI
jgi:uncharacterized protein YqgV (UPF0045/DUF77 family)